MNIQYNTEIFPRKYELMEVALKEASIIHIEWMRYF